MQIGLLTDAFDQMTLSETLAWCAEHELASVELGTCGYSTTPHANLAELGASAAARADLLSEIADHGLTLGALNASGNPLHPNAAIGTVHADGLRATVKLAQELGVTRVVAMSGTPGGPGGGGWPVFAGGAWLPDMEGLWDWQWENAIAPFWSEFSSYAANVAPDVLVCLELHPGTAIYNSESYHQLREVTGPNVVANLDPSHFWWQGMDPITVINDLPGAIGWSHGKDTLLHSDRLARIGALDFRWPRSADEMSWHFAAVGAGHSTEYWAGLIAALRAAGHDGTISIEHEDPNLTPIEGVLASLSGLRAALAV
jgi:sugar phosphate isomerase/epimerase